MLSALFSIVKLYSCYCYMNDFNCNKDKCSTDTKNEEIWFIRSYLNTISVIIPEEIEERGETQVTSVSNDCYNS